jgi:hypothetical protein
MARQRFDIGSKWLLQEQGKGVLLLGGFEDVRRIETMPGEIVQNRKYPDGLLRVYLASERKPYHVLIEVATYAEKRAQKQALDDLALAYSSLGYLPELLMLVLSPKGKFALTVVTSCRASWEGRGWKCSGRWSNYGHYRRRSSWPPAMWA